MNASGPAISLKVVTPTLLKITVVAGPHEGEFFTFAKEVITVGRGPENDITLINDSRISRHHLNIVFIIQNENTFYRLENASKKNPLIINNEVVTSAQVAPSQKILIGESELLFEYKIPLDIAKIKSEPKETPKLKPMYEPLLATAAPVSLPPQPKRRPPQKPATNESLKPVLVFTGILITILVLFQLRTKTGSNGPRKGIPLRSEINQQELNRNKIIAEEYLNTNKVRSDGTVDSEHETAQTWYIKGFRDYTNGQYGRAMTAFQTTLSFEPNHALSKEYYEKSKTKLAALIALNYQNGRAYFDQGSYHKCRASLMLALNMITSTDHPLYAEIKELHSTCDLMTKGRY